MGCTIEVGKACLKVALQQRAGMPPTCTTAKGTALLQPAFRALDYTTAEGTANLGLYYSRGRGVPAGHSTAEDVASLQAILQQRALQASEHRA